MSGNLLPKMIQPAQLAKRSAHLAGLLPLREMKRLKPYFYQSDNVKEIAVDIQFCVDKEGLSYLHGTITGILPLVCQCCFKLLDYDVNIAFNLSPVTNDSEAKHLPSDYEPLLVNDERQVELATVIEDEILLSLPLLISHTEKCCEFK